MSRYDWMAYLINPKSKNLIELKHNLKICKKQYFFTVNKYDKNLS